MLGNQLKVPVYLIITFYLRRNSISTTAVESLAPDFSSPITLGSPRKAVFDLNKGEERFTEGTTGQITDSFGWGELASKGKASQESSVPSASGTLPKLLPDNQISEINTVAEEGEKLEIASYERPVEERKIASSPVRNERKNKKSRKNKNKRKNKNQTKNVEAVPKEAPGMKASFLPENEVSGVQSRQLSHYNSKESDQSKKQLNQDLDRIIHELTSQSNISLKQILPAKEEPDAASSISNSIQWIFNSERELEEKMSEEAIEKIKRAFQPNPSENPGEIYPGVIKGIFSEIVHTSQDLLIEIVQSIPSSEESIEALSSGDLIEKVSQNHTNLVVKIFGNQLQISNAQNNIPLQEMSEEIYTKLKLLWNLDPEVAALGIKQLGIANCKLNKYEFLRRTITLANQIVQKTILENWVLVKQNLIEKKEEKPSFLNKVEDYFKLQTEFPDPLTWANTKYTKYYPEDKTSKNPQKKANSLYRSVVGISENNRRLQAAHDFIKDSKKMKMQQEMKEKLQKAERLNGVSILNVSHFIHYLGLGQSKNVIQSWDINKVIQHIQILNTIISSSIWHTEISWYKSADRAWLREFFGEEYDEKLKLLCQRASGVQYWEYLQNPLRYWPEDSRIEPDLNHERISEIIDLMDYRDEQRLIVMEHGLNGQIIGTIRLLKDQHTNLEGHTKWESVWNSFPLEFQISPEQKEFAKYWIDDISKQGIDLLFFGLDHERRID